MQLGIFTTKMRGEFLKGQQLQPENVTDWKPFTFEVPSDQRFEVYPGVWDIPRLKRYVGHREYASADYLNFTVENLEQAAGLRVPLRDIEDDRLAVYEQVFKGMGQDSTFAFPPRTIVSTLAAGAAKPCFDGSNFFATAHNLGGGNSTLPTNYTGGLNSLSYTAQAGLGSGNYKACFLLHGGIMKPVMYQMRKPPKILTNSGDNECYESKEVRYWVDAEVAVAFTQWWQACLVDISGMPGIADCYSVIDTAINQLRTFTLPQSSPVDPLVYANGSFVPNPKYCTLIVSAQIGQVFWHTLSEERIGVNVAGSNSGFTNNIYRGTFNLVIDPYMI